MKDHIEKYGSESFKGKLEAKEQAIKARQAGGPAPAPQGPPQGGEGQADPQQLLMAFGQAMEAQDQQAAMEIAMQFTMTVYQSMAQEQQAVASTPAARKGGKAPSFDAQGNLI